MKFESLHLSEPLHQFLEQVFHYHQFKPDHTIERLVPSGHIFLIFELDGFERKVYHNESLVPRQSFQKAWVSGMHKDYISISAHQNSEMLGIQFKSFGAYPFLKLPLHQINDRVLPAEEIFGEEVLQLRDSLVTIESPQGKLKAVESWLLGHYEEDKQPPADLLAILKKLESASMQEYATIVKTYPKTQKHLIDQFKKYIGLSPKYHQRILRFNEILQQIYQKEEIKWSQVAYQCEYSDQSHFIKEFKRFSGFNPQKFIQAGYHQEGENFFPLDRPD